jgi:aminocarboxymuconate-semialdehyde decarboxylase
MTDVHTHLIPSGLVERIGRGWLAADARDGSLVVDGVEIAVEALYEPSSLVAMLDRRAVGSACVSIPPPLYRQHLGEADASAWVEAVNDGLERLCGAYRARFRGLAHLPIEHPRLAVAEAERRCGKEWAGFAIASHAPRVTLSDPALRPLWSVLNSDGGSFVFVHPAEPEDARLSRWYLANLLGNPYETALAAAHLVFGGVVSSFPDIRFCLAHAGGVTAAVASRWQRGYETKRPGLPRERSPDELLRRLYADCVVFDRPYLDLTASVFGEEHVLLGSDWPFPMGQSEGLAAALLRANSRRALGLVIAEVQA